MTPADGTYILRVSGNNSSRGWGTAGVNRGNVTFKLSGQTISGDNYVDSISTLDMQIAGSSTFTGSINSDGTQASSLSVRLDTTSTWTLTADSYVTSFNGSLTNVAANGHTLFVNGSAVN